MKIEVMLMCGENHTLKIKSTWTNLRPDSLGDKNVVHVDVKFCALFTQSAPFCNFVGYRIMPVSSQVGWKVCKTSRKWDDFWLTFSFRSLCTLEQVRIHRWCRFWPMLSWYRTTHSWRYRRVQNPRHGSEPNCSERQHFWRYSDGGVLALFDFS